MLLVEGVRSMLITSYKAMDCLLFLIKWSAFILLVHIKEPSPMNYDGTYCQTFPNI